MIGRGAVADDGPRKGVKTKLLGVVLVFLGAMDSMLSWRGGFAVSGYYFLLIALGVFVYVIGAIRAGPANEDRPARIDPDRVA